MMQACTGPNPLLPRHNMRRDTMRTLQFIMLLLLPLVLVGGCSSQSVELPEDPAPRPQLDPVNRTAVMKPPKAPLQEKGHVYGKPKVFSNQKED